MKKFNLKAGLLLAASGAAVLVSGLLSPQPALAFEAHVLEVKATFGEGEHGIDIQYRSPDAGGGGRIRNALFVNLLSVDFGAIFPQESLNESFDVSLTEAFMTEGRVNSATYNVVQKRKCKTFDETGVNCVEYYPDLCPYLSKQPRASEVGDSGVAAPHETEPYPIAQGRLDKRAFDVSDGWELGVKGPCFEGECEQGYDPQTFGRPLSQELKGQTFGCDLWVEVTGISEDADLSPQQVAAEPLVQDVTQWDKKIARIIVKLWTDPLNQAAGKVVAGGTLLLCAGDAELLSRFVACASSWGIGQAKAVAVKFVVTQSAIAVLEDPPRNDYDVVKKIKPAKPERPSDGTALDSATERRLTTLRRQADLLEALRITMERLQGAFLANEGRFMLLQGAALRDLTERLKDNHEHQAEVARQLSHLIGKDWNGELDSWLSRIIGEGFSPEERQAFIEAGFTPGEIDDFEAEFAAIAQTEDYLPSMLAYFENEATAAESAAQGLRDALAIIDSSLTELLSVVCPDIDNTEECVEG